MRRLIIAFLLITQGAAADVRTQFLPQGDTFRRAGAGVRSLGELETWMAQNNITNLEQLMAYVPGGFRSQFVTLKGTNSDRAASEEYPNFVMYDGEFNNGNSLAFVITTDPRNPKFNMLQAWEYNADHRKFNLKTYDFSSSSLTPTAQHSPHPGEQNSRACAKCHGPDPNDMHPNWEKYPFWSHAVGQEDELTKDEIARLRQYASDAQSSHDLRQQLAQGRSVPLEEGQANRLLADARISLLDFEANIAKSQKSVKASPAFDLDTHLDKYNSHRLERKIIQTPNYGNYKFAIMGALWNCDDIASFLPTSGPAAALGGSERAKWYATNTKERMDATLADDSKRRRNRQGGHFLLDEGVERLAKTRFLIESRGVSFDDWFTSTEHDELYDDGSTSTLRDAGINLYRDDPEIRAIYDSIHNLASDATNVWAKEGAKVFCDQLRQYSLSRLQENFTPTRPAAPAPQLAEGQSTSTPSFIDHSARPSGGNSRGLASVEVGRPLGAASPLARFLGNTPSAGTGLSNGFSDGPRLRWSIDPQTGKVKLAWENLPTYWNTPWRLIGPRYFWNRGQLYYQPAHWGFANAANPGNPQSSRLSGARMPTFTRPAFGSGLANANSGGFFFRLFGGGGLRLFRR